MRIVTCAPNLAEMVFAVGAGDRVVGVSRFTEYPPEAAKLPAVTDLQTPGIESILALRPTLLLTIPSNTRVREFFERQPNVRVVDIGRCESFEEVAGALETVGDAVGEPERGRSLARELREGVRAARASAPAQRRKVLLLLGGPLDSPGMMTAVGRGTYLNEMLEAAGGENVLAAEHGIYPVLNRELLVRLDPELIVFFTKRPEESQLPAIRKHWESMATMRAARGAAGFRYVEDPGLLVPGPRALRGVEAMRRALAE